MPQLRQQLVEMQHWSREAQTLVAQPAEKVWLASDVVARLESRMKSGEIRVSGAQVMVDGEGRLRVSGKAPFVVWLDLVAFLQNDFHYFPVTVGVHSESAGAVRFDAAFSTIKR